LQLFFLVKPLPNHFCIVCAFKTSLQASAAETVTPMHGHHFVTNRLAIYSLRVPTSFHRVTQIKSLCPFQFCASAIASKDLFTKSESSLHVHG
jgi:hypothetical protein